MDVKYVIKIYINAQSAESTPPLGTVLGNIGVNAVKFCKEFNEFTSELPAYFQLVVTINIFENKSYTFTTEFGSLGYVINLLKMEMEFESDKILLSQLVQLALFKFSHYSLEASMSMLLGAISGSELEVIDDLSSDDEIFESTELYENGTT
jgi:ribosomal protein L11